MDVTQVIELLALVLAAIELGLDIGNRRRK